MGQSRDAERARERGLSSVHFFFSLAVHLAMPRAVTSKTRVLSWLARAWCTRTLKHTQPTASRAFVAQRSLLTHLKS